MGWINSDSDSKLEKKLHKDFAIRREVGEWFDINHNDILPILEEAGSNGFIATNADAFQIIGFDKDAIPEYVGICKWADLEIEQCCPFCGCLGGMHYQEASSMYYCIDCNELTDFSEGDNL